MVKMRNFKENPLTLSEMQDCYWYAVENDLIGGYSIATVNKPESQMNVFDDEFVVGAFMTHDLAQHIADIHNQWWEAKVWESYESNLEAGLFNSISDYYGGVGPLPDGVVALTEDDWFHYSTEHEET